MPEGHFYLLCDLARSECTPPQTLLASGIINQGEALITPNGKAAFRLDDLTGLWIPGSIQVKEASISVIDNLPRDGGVPASPLIFTIKEGEKKIIEFDGEKYAVTAVELMLGYTFGAKWAHLEILSC